MSAILFSSRSCRLNYFAARMSPVRREGIKNCCMSVRVKRAETPSPLPFGSERCFLPTGITFFLLVFPRTADASYTVIMVIVCRFDDYQTLARRTKKTDFVKLVVRTYGGRGGRALLDNHVKMSLLCTHRFLCMITKCRRSADK